LTHPLGEGLRGNVQCSSWADWKARRGIPVTVNWSFFARCYGWVATRYERRDRKSAISLQRGHFDQTFQVEGLRSPPPIIFARLVGLTNALQLCRW